MDRTDRLRTFESNYGRDLGWYVEKQGVTVVALVDPQREDMFLHSYRLEPVEGTSLPAVVFRPDFWDGGDLVFRNRGTGEVVRKAFAGGTMPTREHPRVIMRALYSRLHPSLVERVILWYRRVKRAREDRA